MGSTAERMNEFTVFSSSFFFFFFTKRRKGRRAEIRELFWEQTRFLGTGIIVDIFQREDHVQNAGPWRTGRGVEERH